MPFISYDEYIHDADMTSALTAIDNKDAPAFISLMGKIDLDAEITLKVGHWQQGAKTQWGKCTEPFLVTVQERLPKALIPMLLQGARNGIDKVAFMAVYNQNIKVMNCIFQQCGFDANKYTIPGKNSEDALCYCCLTGRIKSARTLILNGANPFIRTGKQVNILGRPQNDVFAILNDPGLKYYHKVEMQAILDFIKALPIYHPELHQRFQDELAKKQEIEQESIVKTDFGLSP